jgi:hypothetical protein
MTQFSGFWLVLYYVLLYTTMAAALLFVIGYGFLMAWWKREEGRHLFFYSLAVADAFILICLRPIFGDFAGRAVLTMFCLVSLCAVVVWRLVLFARSYWHNRPSRRALGLAENGEKTRRTP